MERTYPSCNFVVNTQNNTIDPDYPYYLVSFVSRDGLTFLPIPVIKDTAEIIHRFLNNIDRKVASKIVLPVSPPINDITLVYDSQNNVINYTNRFRNATRTATIPICLEIMEALYNATEEIIP